MGSAQRIWVWMRIGDTDDYHRCDSLEDAAEKFATEADDWELTWQERGFTARGFEDRNYVSLFWGEGDSSFYRDLDKQERYDFWSALVQQKCRSPLVAACVLMLECLTEGTAAEYLPVNPESLLCVKVAREALEKERP